MSRPAVLVLLVSIASALAGGAAGQPPPEGATGPEVWQARQDGVPVRTDPGFLFREVRTLSAGEEVLVDGRKGDWLHVRATGWVFADHLVRPAAVPDAAGGRDMVVARSGARVRQGPGTGFTVIATLDEGAVVSVVGEQDGWYQLATGGYLFKDLLAEKAGGGGAAARGAGSEWTVVAESANARSGPSPDKPVVARYAAGHRVAVARVVDGWAEIPGVGFIRQDLLKAPDAGGAPPPRAARPAGSQLTAGTGGPGRWALMDLHGTVFEVREIDPRSEFLATLRREMRATGLLEDDWTIMSLSIGVPPDSAYRFNYEPDVNATVVIDKEGARYGNVYVRGSIDRLPAHVRQLLAPRTVSQGDRYDGILLFRPTLRTRDIHEIWMFVGGRLQQLYPAPP